MDDSIEVVALLKGSFNSSRAIVVALLLISSLFMLTGCQSEELKAAKEGFNDEIQRIDSQIAAIEDEIAAAELLATTQEKPLDETVIPSLESAISQAKTIQFDAPSASSDVEEVKAETERLKGIDYEADLQALKDAEKAVTDSIEKMKLVNNPSEAFVIERLQGVDGVGDISAVTEDNDPNGNLGKAGGYTATVYFTSPMVDQSLTYGETVIEKGCDGGGAIEVYANENDAKRRDSYLGAFDGGFASSGSHCVVGTVLVRTSDQLTASQQKQLEAAIIEALTKLD